MKLKKSLDDCGIGEVKNPETLSKFTGKYT
jgi:hypothetical protein